MAIDYSGLGASYAGTRQATQGPSAYEQLFGTPEENYQRELKGSIDKNLDALVKASAFDVGEWNAQGVDFETISNAGTAYLSFKNTLGGRAKRYGKKNNLLDPIVFKRQYDMYVQSLGPEVLNKLLSHQAYNKLTDIDMRELLDAQPGLRKFLMGTNLGVGPDGMPIPLPGWIAPRKTDMESLQEFGQKWLNPAEYGLGTKAALGAAALTYPMWKGAAAKVGSKIPGIVTGTGKGAQMARTAGLYGVTKGLGQAARLAGRAGGLGKKGQALAQEGGEMLSTAALYGLPRTEAAKKLAKTGLPKGIMAKIKKHGTSKVMKQVAKKLGWKVAAKTIGKMGLGALGSTATGGLAAPLMVAWTVKDIYDVANVINAMD